MKNLFLKLCRALLPLFGVTTAISCDNVILGPDMYGSPVAEYGTPVMEFRMKGKVVDSMTGEPVKGVAVTNADPEQMWESADTVFTSADGSFDVHGYDFPSEKRLLKFTDVDGEENGMYFTDDVELSLVKKETGDGRWFSGVYIAEDVLVRLEPVISAEYGTPMVEFSVKGRVLNEDASPVENIEVTAINLYQTVRTAADGTFHISGEMIGFEMTDITLGFEDTDGENNGGEFEGSTMDIKLVKTDSGDGKWDNGDYQAENVEVVLKKKS